MSRHPVCLSPIARRVQGGAPRSAARRGESRTHRLQRRMGNQAVQRLLRAGSGGAVIRRQGGATGPAVEELPQPPMAVITWDGDRFGPKIQIKNIPGLPDTPPVPLDFRQIPDYIKDKLGGLIPGSPPGPGAPSLPGPGPGTPTQIVIPLPTDVFQKMCQDFPALCAPKQGPTLGLPVPFRDLRVVFKRGRPKTGDGLDASLASGRGAIDEAITAMGDILVTAVLVGNTSSEGKPSDNFDLADRRVALVHEALSEAKVGWRVFDPEISFEDLDGCRSLGIGRWSCGEEKANQERVEPTDRNVLIALYRRLVFEPPPPPPLKPSLPWSGGPIGPF
jgi:hypothetical protein